MSKVIHPADMALLKPTFPAAPGKFLNNERGKPKSTCSSEKIRLRHASFSNQPPNDCFVTAMLDHSLPFFGHLPSVVKDSSSTFRLIILTFFRCLVQPRPSAEAAQEDFSQLQQLFDVRNPTWANIILPMRNKIGCAGS